jgi:peptidoglycan hydrolase-like protein with peptidoglycan-binding domain
VKPARIVLATAICAGFLFGAAAQKSAKPASSSKSSKSSKPASKTSKSKSRSSAKGKKRPSTQQTPDPARIREIQEALTARGYAVEATGAWGPQSAEALKRFQEDNKIDNLSGLGKLDSLTLIALGLGPNRQPAATGAPAAAAASESKPQ